MKKYFYLIFCAVGILSFQKAEAQTFAIEADTVTMNITSNAEITGYDTVSAIPSTSTVAVNWTVIASNIPASWWPYLQICDNGQCHNNTPLGSSPYPVWNGTSGTVYPATYTPTNGSNFDVAVDSILTTSETGCYYLTVSVQDQHSASHKNMVFIICRAVGAGVPTVTREEDIVLYPNPAHNEVNIVYGANAGVKTIAIYNLIGKVVSVFKPLDNNSAMLSVDNIPSGIYFIRLMNSQGAVVDDKKIYASVIRNSQDI